MPIEYRFQVPCDFVSAGLPSQQPQYQKLVHMILSPQLPVRWALDTQFASDNLPKFWCLFSHEPLPREVAPYWPRAPWTSKRMSSKEEVARPMAPRDHHRKYQRAQGRVPCQPAKAAYARDATFCSGRGARLLIFGQFGWYSVQMYGCTAYSFV